MAVCQKLCQEPYYRAVGYSSNDCEVGTLTAQFYSDRGHKGGMEGADAGLGAEPHLGISAHAPKRIQHHLCHYFLIAQTAAW